MGVICPKQFFYLPSTGQEADMQLSILGKMGCHSERKVEIDRSVIVKEKSTSSGTGTNEKPVIEIRLQKFGGGLDEEE